MGRGYSAVRAGSARVDKKMKRTRSVSMAKMSEKIADANEGIINDSDSVASEEDMARISDTGVLSKYKSAGQITDAVLKQVCDACVEGANTYNLCKMGDEELVKQTTKVFRHAKTEGGEKMQRGISYPTTVSVNQVLCNHCPLTESEGLVLAQGDIVKVHLGCHIDGFPAQAAKTLIVGDVTVNQPHADAIQASAVSMNAMIRLCRPGTENGTVTDAIAHIGHHFGSQPIEGVLSTRTKQWITDANEAIISKRVMKENPQQDVAPCTIEKFQVWTLDVAFTSHANYKMQLSDEPLNIYRKNEIRDQVRLPAAEFVLNECKHKFLCFPFHANMSSAPLKAKLGIKACNQAHMLDTFPALRTKPGAITSRYCCTVAVTDKKVHILCGEPPAADENAACSQKLVPTTMSDILNLPMNFNEKKAKKVMESEEAEEDEDEDRPRAKKQRR